jgi:hypothetical protein
MDASSAMAETGMDSAAGSDTMPPPAENAPTQPIPAEMLPKGAKAGDKLVLGQPDEEGNFPVTLEAGDGPKEDKEGAEREQWADDFRKHMAPSMSEEST